MCVIGGEVTVRQEFEVEGWEETELVERLEFYTWKMQGKWERLCMHLVVDGIPW